MATLFSAVKALAEGLGEKIFYLTSKTVQRQLAESALEQMTEKGLHMRSITLTAKDKICFRVAHGGTRACNPTLCEYADGHFDRVNAAILDCIRNETLICRETIEGYAKQHKVCPSEYALDLSVFCHVIICDYNHAYDPKAKLRRFFMDKNDFILLHDEAHNLVDRGREMFSATVHRRDFIALRKNLGRSHSLYKILGKVAKGLRDYSNLSNSSNLSNLSNLSNSNLLNSPNMSSTSNTSNILNIEPDVKSELASILAEFAVACELWLKEHPQNGEEILMPYFNALDYLRVAELYDERYTTLLEKDCVRLFCLDPSFLLAMEQKKVRSCVFFSATLSPIPYFQSILGGGDEDYLLRLGSPFPRKNLSLVIEARVSTKYKQRDLSLDTIVHSLHIMVQAKSGAYMAFFPSYAYLNQVYERYIELYGATNTLRQEQGAGLERDFLARYNGQSELLGFAVLGGALSEGIDLKGERLIGVAIVGIGLPQISIERDTIMEHFKAQQQNGFNVAYLYPGMTKVMQAAGRVIRTERDKGVVLLIDSRFLDNTSLFPAEWEGYIRLVNPNDKLEDALENFWR